MKARAPAALVLGLAAAGATAADCQSAREGASAGGAGTSSTTGATTTGPPPYVGSSSTVTTGSGGSGAGNAACMPSQCALDEPPGFPGWMRLCSWSSACPLYVPTHAKYLPAPIAWKACPDDGSGITCRKMKVDWTTDYTGGPINTGSMSIGAMDFDQTTGKSTLYFRRVATTEGTKQGYLVDLIAEADGPVRDALLSVPNPGGTVAGGCGNFDGTIGGGRFVWSLTGKDGCGSVFSSTQADEAAFGGKVGDLAPAFRAPCKDARCSFTAGSGFVVRLATGGVLTAFDWLGSPGQLVASAATDPDGLSPWLGFSHGNAVFYETSDSASAAINVWTLAGGAKPFIRYVGETTRAAGSFGTDEHDMVWSYGQGTPTKSGTWPTVEVWTAPYTADPSAVRSKRVRSCPRKLIAPFEPWVVGCGYAAKVGSPNIMVVRLSDGVAWFLPYDDYTKGGLLTFATPIGITCDEVFVQGWYPESNVARVRLDSLGPGTPPD